MYFWEWNINYADSLQLANTDSEQTTMHIIKVISTLITNGNSSFLILHSPAMDWNGSILAKLLFCFMNLANEVNKSFSRLWHSLFWPVSELELPHCSGLTVLQREATYPATKKNARRIQPVYRPQQQEWFFFFPERRKKLGGGVRKS